MAGSGGVVVFDETTDVVALCATIMHFYAHESCGQCTPCREGTAWLARVCTRLADGEGRPGDVDLLANIASGIARQHHLPARRGGGLADARVSHQVPRRLRGQAQGQQGGLSREHRARRADPARQDRLRRFRRRAARLSPCFTITRKSAGDRGHVAGRRRSSPWPAIYATLSAHFLAVLQILVYAGAIMVLFIFVVMILNRDEEHPIALRGLFLRAAGVLAAGYLFYRLAWIVVRERQHRRAGHDHHLAHPRATARSLPSATAVPRLPLPLRGDLAAAAGRGGGGVLLARPRRRLRRPTQPSKSTQASRASDAGGAT